MNNIYYKYKKIFLILIVVLATNNLYGQNEPFDCQTEAYLFQANDVYAQNLASGSASLDGIDIDPSNINGVGYNNKDGYIWGSLKSPSNTIVRIGNNYDVTTYTLSNAPFSYVGDVSPEGIMHLKNGSSSFYMIDLDPESSNYLTNIGSRTLSEAITNHDWAFNAVDNMLYTVEKNSNILFKIDPETGNVQSLGEVPVLAGLSYTYGAVYFDVEGNFYISANQTGTVYIVYGVQNITPGGEMTSNLFAYGPSSSSNDGARCPTAPVPQEDCTNGRDDDGDGLVDCDDPSCSGVSECPVLTPITSGNRGGLESNNRLSQQINQRNINRIKTNYKFDKNLARRVSDKKIYSKKSFGNVSLWDFIPVNIFDNSEVVESTPEDLKNITNAVEVISVDYLKENENFGTLLVLETEGKVYEHTKHICDRFTGAQLLSVSNIEIDNEFFIKSVIKQPDGSMEFVLSFSVRPSEDFESYVVESHWNLDKYEDGTFFNFQIWTSTIDDLYLIGREVLKLVKVQKDITDYKNSEAPSIYVRKASYTKGVIGMEVINKSKSATVLLEGYKRATETSDDEKMTYNIDLPEYINKVNLETGSLYDFGFRISKGDNSTPDDLFISDGTWGIDYSSESYVKSFEVTQNDETPDEETYKIERDISFSTEGNHDVSIYRSLTPKFEKVDLTDYRMMSFKAKGKGKLKVTLVKDGISSWEDQPYAIVDLLDVEQNFIINKNDFNTTSTEELKLDDIKMLFFTSLASSEFEKNTIEIKEAQFLKENTASVSDVLKEKAIEVVPNPIEQKADFNFYSITSQNLDFEIYNILSKRVLYKEVKVDQGNNTIKFDKGDLEAGIYFYRIGNKSSEQKGKIVIK